MVAANARSKFRRCFIDLALKRARPSSGSSLAFLQRRTWVHGVTNLNSILSQHSFVIVGGVATRLYMPERLTLDLDILVLAQDSQKIYAQLKAAGGRQIGELGIPGSQWELSDGTALDVLISDETWVIQALNQPNYSPDGLPVVALPYLVLMKLRASRAQDLADISRMLGGADAKSLAEVRRILAEYLPEAVEDLESLIMLGQLEFKTD